jgi:HSP20 family molecular chaperone IbpA
VLERLEIEQRTCDRHMQERNDTPRTSTAISLNGKLRGILKDVKEILVDEWSVGSYHRELDLVVGVSGERANVTCENGVLREECT